MDMDNDIDIDIDMDNDMDIDNDKRNSFARDYMSREIARAYLKP